MISAGKTAEIKVGRQLLCKEKPNTKPTSACAKNVAKTVKAAKKGLTVKQQKLWRQMVYTPAILQARLFCSSARRYKACINKVLTGKTKFKGLFGKKFKWADFLVKGAAIIKKLPKVVEKKCKDPNAVRNRAGKCVYKTGHKPDSIGKCKKKYTPVIDGAE